LIVFPRRFRIDLQGGSTPLKLNQARPWTKKRSSPQLFFTAALEMASADLRAAYLG
jgi:hypothetical protein